MRVALIGYGMQFDYDTLSRTGLGGSETAQLCMGIELAKLGIEVQQVCNLTPGAGGLRGGVHYRHLSEITDITPVDFAIIARQPGLIDAVFHKARRCVLWIQDFATPEYPPRMPRVSEGFTEIWAVSQWQARQWTRMLMPRFPSPPVDLPGFWITRNGIPRVEFERQPAVPKQLVFASRPERGLWALVRPGGIMSRLPDYTLKVAGYTDYPDQYAKFYRQINQYIRALANVEHVGSLSAPALRSLIHSSAAYVMPTPYRETSCILARECIEQQTPMIMTPSDLSGALPETLAECQVIGSYQPFDTDGFCQDFAGTTQRVVESGFGEHVSNLMAARTDLYWDQVAKEWQHTMLKLGVA